MTSMQEATDTLCKATWRTEEGDELETDGGIDFIILKAICKKTLFARDVWVRVVAPLLRQGQAWFVIDGESLAEVAETTRCRVDGRAGRVAGLQLTVNFELDNGEQVTCTAHLVSIKVKVVPFRALVRRQALLRRQARA